MTSDDEPDMDARNPPTEWEDEDWLFVMMALQDFAEQPIESGDRIEDIMEMSGDGYSVRAIQLRDGIADYLGIRVGEAEEQLRGGSGEE